MIWWRRLQQEENGQVLYLTIVAMMFLVVFSLVLVNVIYICVLKVKAQNAADNLALSAATLKARVLNQVANCNAIWYFIVQKSGQIPASPYASPGEFGTMAGIDAFVYGTYSKLVLEYNKNIYQDQWLDGIARANGLVDATNSVKIFPLEMDPAASFCPQIVSVSYLQPSPPATIGTFPLIGNMEPVDPPWWIQTRVEWPARGRAIGFKNLQVVLPDIVTRARAEIFDAGGPMPYAHCWQVRLIQPDVDLDEKLKNSNWIW
jgi:hypothetical protein